MRDRVSEDSLALVLLVLAGFNLLMAIVLDSLLMTFLAGFIALIAIAIIYKKGHHHDP